MSSLSLTTFNRKQKLFLLFLLVTSFIITLPIFNQIELNEDVTMILGPTRNLVKTGNLKNIGLFTAFQALRPDFSLQQGYWFNYIGPVLLFFPAFKLFGSSDYSFFLTQTLLILSLFYILFKKTGSVFWTCLIFFLAHFFKTLEGSIYFCTSQLPAICITLLTWEFWEQNSYTKFKFIICGILLGMGVHFRPEVVFILLLGMSHLLTKTKNRLLRRDLLLLLPYLLVPFLLTYFPISKLRYLMGGITSTDHTFFTLGYDVFAPGWNTLSLESTSPLIDIFRSPKLFANLCLKIKQFFYFFLGRGAFWQRKDCVFWFSSGVMYALGFSRKSYINIFLILFGQLFVTSLVNDAPRYFDCASLLVLVQIIKDLIHQRKKNNSASKSLFCCLVFIFSINIYTGIPQLIRTNSIGLNSKLFERDLIYKSSIPNDAFVITDSSSRCYWYTQLNYCCFAPWNKKTMALLFKKFPNAYVLLFEGKTRIGEGYQGIPYATTHTKQEINQSELFYPRHNLIQNNNNPSQLSNSR